MVKPILGQDWGAGGQKKFLIEEQCGLVGMQPDSRAITGDTRCPSSFSNKQG